MKRLLIFVEGQTEERFVKDVLQPFFQTKGTCLIPTIVNTKIVKSGPSYKGGLLSYVNAKRDLYKLLGDTDALVVTTMWDLYGLPKDFPAWSNQGSAYEKVQAAEQAFKQDINHPKFLPYIQLHEFEGLLFSLPKIVSDTLDPRQELEIRKIRDAYSSPEEINQGKETHPSKRLLKLFPRYNKPIFGSLIATRTGIDEIRGNCPHFNDWITRLLEVCADV